MSTEQCVRVTRDVSRHDPLNWSDLDVGRGAVFYRYTGPKWGVVHDDETTVVLSREPGGEFFEFPADAVEDCPCGQAEDDEAEAPHRKPNRVSRPVRATQRGTSTSYPHADHRKMARLRSRWGAAAQQVGSGWPAS